MKYDVFISYRRDGGYETAKHLYDLLSREGYSVSFDIDTLRNGNFDTELLKRIDQCKDFILIVNSTAFDRVFDPSFPKEKDWLRCELSYALSKNKNIIPVFLAGVNGFPDSLPVDIADVVRKNGPIYNQYYFDDFFRKLKEDFLISRPAKRIRKIVLYSIMSSLIVLLLACFLFYLTDKYNDDVDNTSSTYNSYETINGTKFYSDYSKLYVGDYVYEDGTFTHKLSTGKRVCGVVISLKTTLEEYKKGWTHGTIMALSDVNGDERFQWSKNIDGEEHFAAYSIDEIQYAINDRNGYIYACHYLKERDKYPAFGVLDLQPCITNSSGWYIPTLGQWAEILNFVGGAGISTYNNRLLYSLDHTADGFVKYGFSTSYYWTSNLRDPRTVWTLYLGNDESPNDYLNKIEYAKIRAVASI